MRTIRQINLSILIIFLFIPIFGISQEKRSFAGIDTLSYKAYLAGNWQEVLDYAHDGFESGYDYYYLRMRAGVAELNRNRPLPAINHFRKALEFSENDPTALDYLYRSLLFSGDPGESRLLVSTFTPEARKRNGIPERKLMSSAFFEPGTMINPKANELKAVRPEYELAHLYLVPVYWYISAGINLEIGSRFSGTLAANQLTFKAIQQFLYQFQEPTVFEVPYDQRAVYAAGSYYLGKGFHVTAAGQVLSYDLPLYHWEAAEVGGAYVMDVTAYKDLALNVSLARRFPYLTAGVSADANRIKSQWYRQAGADLTLYPAGNVNTYLRLAGSWVSDSTGWAGRIILHGSAGRKLFRSVWFEGDYYYGDIRNFSEANAYIVFNNFDLIRRRMGASLLAYRVLPHLDVALRYQYTLRTASWQFYENSEYSGVLQQDYPVNSLIIGLTWRF